MVIIKFLSHGYTNQVRTESFHSERKPGINNTVLVRFIITFASSLPWVIKRVVGKVAETALQIDLTSPHRPEGGID